MTDKNTGKVPDNKIFDETSVKIVDAPPENDSSLQSLIGEEQSYSRERLREELGREPTDEEANEWLSAHTEGY